MTEQTEQPTRPPFRRIAVSQVEDHPGALPGWTRWHFTLHVLDGSFMGDATQAYDIEGDDPPTYRHLTLIREHIAKTNSRPVNCFVVTFFHRLG